MPIEAKFRFPGTCALLVVALTLGPDLARAQSTPQPAQPPSQPDRTTQQSGPLTPQPAEQPPVQRADPFSPTEVFKEGAGPAPETRQRRFVPAITRPSRLPELRLRGIAKGAGDAKPTVLLEIEGYGTYIVTEGDTISLQDLAAENVIRIKEITRISVIIEAGSFGELIVVR